MKLLSGKDNKIVKSRWNGGGSTEDAPDLQPDTYGLGVKKNADHKWFVIDKVDNNILKFLKFNKKYLRRKTATGCNTTFDI